MKKCCSVPCLLHVVRRREVSEFFNAFWTPVLPPLHNHLTSHDASLTHRKDECRKWQEPRNTIKEKPKWVIYNFKFCFVFFLIMAKDLCLSSARNLGRWAVCPGGKAPCHLSRVQREMWTEQSPHPAPASGFAWTSFWISLLLPLGLKCFKEALQDLWNFALIWRQGKFYPQFKWVQRQESPRQFGNM